jgi:hypothetical protein
MFLLRFTGDSGLSTVPTIEPGLRRNIKATSREFGEVRASRSSSLRMAAAKTRESEAPAELLNSGPRRELLPAFLRNSRERCSAHGRDAAQQELRPPGTASCQKVNMIGLTDCGRANWPPCLVSGCVQLPDRSGLSDKRQFRCLESYPVRVGDDGKRVAGETGCELWEGAFNVVVDSHSETTDCDPVSVQPSCPVWHQVECSTSRPPRYSCCLQYPNCRRAWATATISTLSPASRYTRLYG